MAAANVLVLHDTGMMSLIWRTFGLEDTVAYD